MKTLFYHLNKQFGHQILKELNKRQNLEICVSKNSEDVYNKSIEEDWDLIITGELPAKIGRDIYRWYNIGNFANES